MAFRKWKHQIGFWALKLRETINNGNGSVESCRNTLSVLKHCYDVIQKKISEDDWWNIEDYYDTLISDIELLSIEDYITREDRLIDVGYDGYNPPLECVDSNLRVFYQICDDYDIWVNIA